MLFLKQINRRFAFITLTYSNNKSDANKEQNKIFLWSIKWKQTA